MRMALARTARLAWDRRGQPAGEGSKVPSSARRNSIEDLARFGGGLSVPGLADGHVSVEQAPVVAGTGYRNDVMPPPA